MKRAGPEEHSEEPLLFAATRRGHAGAEIAAARAEASRPGWESAALEQVRAFAKRRERFTTEEIGLTIPASADPRASGNIMRLARVQGWIEADGYAPTVSSHGSPKVRWRSRIYEVPR